MTLKHSPQWVLVPGTLCTPDVFTPLLDHLGVLEQDRSFIDVKMPDVKDYDAPLRGAVTGGQIVCGFSLGAMILVHNLEVLSKAKALVLLACNPFPDLKENRIKREAVRDRVLSGEARQWVEENWAIMSSDPSKALTERVANMAETTSHAIAAQTELAASRPGAIAEIQATETPLLFVTGSNDMMTPPGPIRPIVQKSKQARLNELEGLGHFALLEAPGRVADAIREGLEVCSPKLNSES